MKRLLFSCFFFFPAALYASMDSIPARLRCPAAADVERILGQPALLQEQGSATKGGRSECKCSYMALDADPATKVKSNLYYAIEEYNTVIAAMNAYINIVETNKNMPGQTTLTGVGDQAFLHTDDKNFMMVICRKGNKMVRVKVNKMTSTTSEKTLLQYVKDCVSMM